MSRKSASPTEASYYGSAFGIVGDFPGDEDLRRELDWCCRAFQSPTAGSKPPLTRLVSLLGSLPLKGRHAVVRRCLASSPHRDAILRDLFDYCYQPDGDQEAEAEEGEDEDEFVVIAHPSTAAGSAGDATTGPPRPLNLNKFHIFRVVTVLMAVSGAAGAEASRRYLRTASTKHRAKILIQCASCFTGEEFTDDELYEQYCSSPSSVQASIIDACKRSGRRKDFLRRVYESDDGSSRNRDLIYWLESDYLANKLDDMIRDKSRAFKLRQWGAHGDLYTDYVRRRMRECGKDQLKLGSTWQSLRQRMELNSIKSGHVFALLEILEEYEACASSARQQEIRTYLEDLSAKGDDISGFDVVTRCQMDSELICKLTNKERLQLAIRYLQAHDWDRFSTVRDEFFLHKLPYRTVYLNAGSDDLWSMLAGHEVDPFLRCFAVDDLFENAPIGPEQLQVLKSWADWHLRSKPSDLSDAQMSQYCHGKSKSAVWDMWYKSYRKFFRYSYHLSDVASVIAKDCRVLKDHRSPRLKVYTMFMQDVLGIAVRALEEVAAHLSVDIALEPIFEILRNIPYVQLSKSELESAQDLGQKGVQIITKNVLPPLRGIMQFDPSLSGTYISSPTLSFFQSRIEEIIDQWALSEEVFRSLALTVLDVSSRASLHQHNSRAFVVVTDVSPPKGRTFAYYNLSLHKHTVETCYRLTKKLLSVVQKIPSFDLSLAKQLWDIVRRNTLSDISAYLAACSAYLPGVLRAEEEPSMIERSTAFISSTYKRAPDSWKTELSPVADQLVTLGLLQTVLDSEKIPTKVRNSLIIEHGGFANEKARQSLKDATFSADGGSRAQGLTVWLAEACKTGSTSLVAEAVSFAASRLKNEPGVH